MQYNEFLTLVIEDGIEAARLHYTHPRDRLKLDGSLCGFAHCRDRTPEELRTLLKRSHLMQSKYEEPDYWYWRSRDAEIEWVCNVVSAMLISQGRLAIDNCTCTVRGMIKAAEVGGEQLMILPGPPRGH